MTPREFGALAEVYEGYIERWAFERAEFRNANRSSESVAWKPEDFLGYGDYEERQREHGREQMRVMQANTNLMKIRKGAPPTEDVPAWALGEYQRTDARGKVDG